MTDSLKTNFLPQPCARWADLLAARPDSLSAAERGALNAHVASCQACAAVRADYQRMDARIRSLPDPRMRPDLPPWLQALQAAGTSDAPAPRVITPLHSMEQHMQTRKEPGLEMPAQTPISQSRSARRRVVSWVAAVAALVVIALITTALLASHSGKPATTGRLQNSTATPSGNQRWNTVPGLAHLAAQPFIAPSNPKVIYLVGSNPGTVPATLRRSDDDGAHWKDLPLPPRASQAESFSFQINAGNAQDVFFMMSFELSPSACSGSQASTGPVNAYSGYSCQVPYYSVDGGAHWGLMRCLLCAPTPFASGGVAPIGTIISQGSHLYSSFYDQNQQAHLMTSADDGATWQLEDGALLTGGQGICSFAAASTGTAVFALVQSGSCSQPVGYLSSRSAHPQAQAGLAVWRSVDAGAHWSRVGNFPYQRPDTANFRAIDTGGAQPTLLAAAGQGASYTRLISADGGKTWQPLPTEGIPANAALLAPQAALSDGSLLAAAQGISASFNEGNNGGNFFQPGSTQAITSGNTGAEAFYALKPGSRTWQQMTPAFSGNLVELVVSSAGGHDTIWAVTTNDQGFFIVVYYTLK